MITAELLKEVGLDEAPEPHYEGLKRNVPKGMLVTTGAVGDLYAISYNYRQLTGAEGASA